MNIEQIYTTQKSTDKKTTKATNISLLATTSKYVH